jgi:hypothetical protein
MTIQGHPISEIIWAIFVILWGLIRFAAIAAIAALIIAGIWLAMNSLLILVFLLAILLLGNVKVNW